jgi:hypothetical protein
MAVTVTLPFPYNRGKVRLPGLSVVDGTGVMAKTPSAKLADLIRGMGGSFTGDPGVVPSTSSFTPKQLSELLGMTGDVLRGARLGTVGKDISATDLNAYLDSGFYRGNGLAHSPDGSADYFHVEAFAHAADGNWATQVAHKFGSTSGSPATFFRTKVNGTWGSWRRVAESTADAAWTSPSLSTGWSTYGNGYATPGYRRDASNVVRLRGLAASAAGLTGAIFTLPTGYRPATQLRIATLSSDAIGTIQVNPASGGGAVLAQRNPGTWISLDGISFLAEA